DKLATNDLRENLIQKVNVDEETYPFFPGKKLIFASNPIFLQAKPEKLLVEELEHKLTALEHYLNDPVDYSTIVFIAPYESIDQRKKLVNYLRKTVLSQNVTLLSHMNKVNG